MKFTRSWLLKNARPSFPINAEVEIAEQLKSKAKNLISVSKATITGSGYYLASADRLELKLKVKVLLVIPCAISLEPVDYPLELELDQWFTFGNEIERDDLIVISKDELDLVEFIVENIYLSIPIKVVKKGAKMAVIKGENWKFQSAEDAPEQTKIDPRLEKLKNFSKDK